jgi:hypothetical protein
LTQAGGSGRAAEGGGPFTLNELDHFCFHGISALCRRASVRPAFVPIVGLEQ